MKKYYPYNWYVAAGLFVFVYIVFVGLTHKSYGATPVETCQWPHVCNQ